VDASFHYCSVDRRLVLDNWTDDDDDDDDDDDINDNDDSSCNDNDSCCVIRASVDAQI